MIYRYVHGVFVAIAAAICLQTALSHGAIAYEVCTGPAASAQVPAWMMMSLECFREYPYLYDGTVASEAEYFAFYAAQPRLMIVVARDAVTGEPVGFLAGLPLVDEKDNKLRPFRAVEYDPAPYFYIAECVVASAFRAQGVARRMYELCEHYVCSYGDVFHGIAACGIERATTPEPSHMDVLASQYGWRRRVELTTQVAWKDVGATEATMKTFVFWTKDLGV